MGGVRSILSAKTMRMEMFLLVNPVTGTGPVREDILVFSAALPCLSLTRTGGGASPLQERRTSAQDQEAGEVRDQEVDHNSHPTLGEEGDRDDSKEAKADHSPLSL